jgi:serine/threonine protein kinase
METRQSRRFGRYEIVAELGRGAVGVVYQARDPQIDRMVALKTILLPGLDPKEEEEYRQRFLVEAQAAGRLQHPGIVTIFDVGEDPEKHDPYIVLEYVTGQSLNQLLVREKKLPLRTALQLAEEIADALDYAHTQGVVHRDIKPANIFVTSRGHAKILDFGLAKVSQPPATESEPTAVLSEEHLHQSWQYLGHSSLHVSGTGFGQGSRRPHGFILIWRRPLRNGHRHAAISRGDFRCNLSRHPEQGADAAGAAECRRSS